MLAEQARRSRGPRLPYPASQGEKGHELAPPADPQRLCRLDGSRRRRPPERRRARRGWRHRRGRPQPRRLRRGADRRDRNDRDAGLRGHAPAHLADARPRRAPELHARPLLRCHARQRRRPLSARGRAHRRLRGRARGAERRRHDAARLVAHQQHARSLGRGDPGAEGRGHPRRLRPRDADRRGVVDAERATIPRTSGGFARRTSPRTTACSRSRWPLVSLAT